MRPGARKALFFTAAFLPLLAVLAALYPFALPSYERAVVALANPFLGAMSPPLRVEVGSQGGNLVPYLLREDGRVKMFEETYHPHVIFLSLVLLPALLAATPAAAKLRLRWLALGMALLFATHVVAIIGMFWAYVRMMDHPANLMYKWVNGLVMTSGQVGPVALWLLFTWSHWTGGAGATAPRRRIE